MTANHLPLTDAEREALQKASRCEDCGVAPHWLDDHYGPAEPYATVERIIAARVAAAVTAERERLAEEWRALPVWGPDPSGLHILDGVDLEGLLDDLWDRRKAPAGRCRRA